MIGVQWSVVVCAAVTDGPENVIAVVIVALHSLVMVFYFFKKGTRLNLVFLITVVVSTRKNCILNNSTRLRQSMRRICHCD